MNGRGGRQFSRDGYDGLDPPRRRRFRGQYVRRRTPDNDYGADQVYSVPGAASGGGGGGGGASGGYSSKSYQDNRHDNRKDNNRSGGGDIDEIKNMFFKLTDELDQVKSRVRELESTGGGNYLRKSFQDSKADIDEMKNMFSKLTTELDQVKNRVRDPESTGSGGKPNQHQSVASKVGGDEITEKDKRNKSKNVKNREKRAAKWAERRAQKKTGKRRTRRERVFPELTETEMNNTVQTWKREFLSSERPVSALKKEMNAKGPKAVYEFAVSILDHAICDVTSPTKLSEIANSLYQLLVSEDNMSEVDFQKGFYDALKNISEREDDIVIDAPRYMDTLGQLLADCVIPMFGKHKNVVKKFLNRCVKAYSPQNKAVLLASIMKAISGIKSDRFAKEIWDTANLNWEALLKEGTDLKEFLELHEVEFTTRTFTPKPKARKRTPEELEKFADDITSAVESRCTPQEIEELVKEFAIEAEEAASCYGTLIYAIVRGCLADSGDYKLNTEALNKYSVILTAQREEQVAIALRALTALTKLWHQYNCPQDLLRTILMELHNLGTAPFESLKTWLNSPSMNNIPGIGAARLNSKRYIEDLEANFKS